MTDLGHSSGPARWPAPSPSPPSSPSASPRSAVPSGSTQDTAGAEEVCAEELKGVPEPLAPPDVPAFFLRHGFSAKATHEWGRGAAPEFRLQVTGHSAAGAHVRYRVECTLAGDQPARWVAHRRLAHLRAGLHDPIRKHLGSSYHTYFAGFPFAQHLRPSGTTARLDAWCQRLAQCISSKLVPPIAAAEALRLLGAPGAWEEPLFEDAAPGAEATSPPAGPMPALSGLACEAAEAPASREPPGAEPDDDAPASPASAASVDSWGTCPVCELDDSGRSGAPAAAAAA